ncbi:2-oxoacid dehydrogenase acyltransferase, catalytic domain [Dillenia turbinata]|uniref:dihydrolipoyllysine-residue succinyltransferase n=1 Tax=Dillenia turbinata TaxID=194707 RepID=A0AAN8W667_9MAGN
MKLRSEYKDAFAEKHGVKLGLMSGFVKAAVSGLQNQPIINAFIDGDDIIYNDCIDISIAVGASKEINTLAKKANDGSISIDEMAGGTFTVSNGVSNPWYALNSFLSNGGWRQNSSKANDVHCANIQPSTH